MRKAALKAALILSVSSLPFAAHAAPARQAMDMQQTENVTVRGQGPQGVDRLPQPVEKQPQSVHVVDEEMLRQQAVTTLDQAVRNIPGITANTGEGGGATAGDQFRIRGFDAQNDIASDGLPRFWRVHARRVQCRKRAGVPRPIGHDVRARQFLAAQSTRRQNSPASMISRRRKSRAVQLTLRARRSTSIAMSAQRPLCGSM